jgi:hypothetical protein
MPKKRQKHCGHIKPHKPHTWDYEPKKSKYPQVEKVWCKGIGNHHVHVWDANSYPIMRRPDGKVAALGEQGIPVTGPFECVCGASAWLTNGYKKRDIVSESRFPEGDALIRIQALKAKLDRGDTLSDADQAELNAIADMLIETFRPMAEALVQLANQMAEYIAAFLDRIDYVKIAEMIELSKTYSGETPDAVETIQLTDGNGEVISEHVIAGGDPFSANHHTAIVSDEEQVFVHGKVRHVDIVPDVTMHPDGSMTANTPLGEYLASPDRQMFPPMHGGR